MKQILHEYLKSCTKQNPLNRYEAAEKLNTTERTIRELISSLRMDGVRVCADSSGKGYWIAEGEQDYAAGGTKTGLSAEVREWPCARGRTRA